MVKILKDNNRLVIIVEDDGTIDMTQLTNNIITRAMELSQPVQQSEIEGLTKLEEEIVENIEEMTESMTEVREIEEEVVEELRKNVIKEGDIAEDKYVGMTPMEAILSDNTTYGQDMITVDLYCNCNQVQNIALRKQIIADLKSYLYTRFHNDLEPENINKIEKDYIVSFFNVYQPIIQGEIKSILQQSGFVELSDFLNDSDLFKLKGAYYNTVKSLMNRLKL